MWHTGEDPELLRWQPRPMILSLTLCLKCPVLTEEACWWKVPAGEAGSGFKSRDVRRAYNLPVPLSLHLTSEDHSNSWLYGVE